MGKVVCKVMEYGALLRLGSLSSDSSSSSRDLVLVLKEIFLVFLLYHMNMELKF